MSFRILPPNITADFVFKTLRYAPLLHDNYISTLGEKQDLYSLQTVLDINNVSIAELFRKVSETINYSRENGRRRYE